VNSVELRVQRIVVAIDESPHAHAALEAAAELARRARAELLGVFVEDAELMRVAGLPFAAELSYLTGEVRALDEGRMQRALDAQAARVRASFESAAKRHGVAGEFRTARGLVRAELTAAARLGEMLVLGKASRARAASLGSTARSLIKQAPGTVVVLKHGAQLTSPVLVPFDGSNGSLRALAMAKQLAGYCDGVLIVLAGGATARELGERAEQSVGAWGARARLMLAPTVADPRALVDATLRERPGTVVVAAESEFTEGAAGYELAAALDCPIVFVR
jgi:nucleotide-binding universal stress UspA family protein